MNITQVIDKLKNFARKQQFVNSVTTGDVYENWNGMPDLKYGSVNIDITQTTINANLQYMQIYLFYADRLTQDHSNEYEIKATAEVVLTNIINYLAEIGDVLDGYVISFFTLRFADDLAGGLVQIQFETERILGDCLIDEYEDTFDKDIIERLKAIILRLEVENAQVAIELKEILKKLTDE